MKSADNQPLEVGQTIFAVAGDHVVEHEIAALEGTSKVVILQPEEGGPTAFHRQRVFVYAAAAEHSLGALQLA